MTSQNAYLLGIGLKVAVERISAMAAEHDPQAAEETVQRSLDTIDELRRERADLYKQLVDLREEEVRPQEHAGYRGTLAAISLQHRAEVARLGWLDEYVAVAPNAESPLNTEEITEWRSYLIDAALAADEPESGQRVLDLATIPEPRMFADLVATERVATAEEKRHEALNDHGAFEAVRRMGPAVRAQLQRRLHELADAADDIARRRGPWTMDALSDVCSGRAGVWQARASQIANLVARAAPLVQHLGHVTEVTVAGADPSPLVGLANAVLQYIKGGGKLKTTPDGSPKLGAFTHRVVKEAQPLFDHVRVDGLPPTAPEQLYAFLVWVDATKTLAALDRAWPEGMSIPPEDTLHERLHWHVTELAQLHRVLDLAQALQAEDRRFAELALPRLDWNDVDAIRGYARLVDAAVASEARTAATEPLREAESVVTEAARWADAAPCIERLRTAVRERDHNAYDGAYRRIQRLGEVRRSAARRELLAARLQAGAPTLRRAIEDSATDPMWNERLAGFERAWKWSATGTWLREREAIDVNTLQSAITRLEERIRHEVETVSATRAWSHAVSAGRITGTARANLTQYAYLVRRHGKGTGKYAALQRAEIRQAMDRCRPAVPVWIMPIYRIAEQLRIQPNMFDVVVIDEASQAGLEATFLQYLAPKIVVIGDDKQVSPTAVGVDQQQLRDLAGQYLADDPYRASWQDPQRSLFDEAKMRYGELITLTEHRRCVPEIIGFSNRIAYEPDGVRLVPVRQYGADRLEPIKAVFLSDGYARGTTSKVNPNAEKISVAAGRDRCCPTA